MGRGTEKAEARRRQVLAAALDVFARDGYGNAAVDDIARASSTSKGGVYFHFPSKQAMFLTLLDDAGALLLGRVERAMAREEEPLARGDAALREVLATFGRNRPLARLLLVEAMGAGKEFQERMAALHDAFARTIAGCLDEAVARGTIPPHDTALAGVAWFGAVNQVVTRWVITGQPRRLEDAYPTLRSLLVHGVTGGGKEAQVR